MMVYYLCFVYSMDVLSASSYYIVVYSYSSQIIQNMVKNFNVEEATSWSAISKHGLGFELWTLMLNTYWPFISYCCCLSTDY